MASEQVSFEISSGVGVLTFESEKANSLSRGLISSIVETLNALNSDSRVGVIVIKSYGAGAFCAGASLEDFENASTVEEAKEVFLGFANLLNSLRKLSKFVICRVQGKAVGGGVGLVAGCDYAVASVHAAVKLPEFEIGLGPFTIGPALVRKMGSTAFTELAVETSWRDAAWAKRVGLYSSLAEGEDSLDKDVWALADTLAKRYPRAATELRGLSWAGTDDWEKRLPELAAVSAQLLIESRDNAPS